MHTVHSFVAVLNILQKRHPAPWYYHEEPEADGYLFTDLRSTLEFLAQEGLIEKAPARDDHSGIGARLTPRGLETLNNPEAMDLLARGQSPSPSSIAGQVRADSTRPMRPWMTYLLMAINIGVYLYGLWKGLRPGSGAVSGDDIIDGRYLKLLTSTFYHGGVLHLLMNMFALWSLGAFVERAWGRFRYVAIYLVAALGGTCMAMAFNPGAVLGASGAVCGMLGAILVYMLTLARYLPRTQSRAMWFNLVVNIILITILSVMPGVSGLGHLGGGIAGALAALVLVWQRFGGWTGAVLGTLAVPLIAIGCFVGLQQIRMRGSEAWTKAEAPYVERLGKNRTMNAVNDTARGYADLVEPLIEQRASRRDPARVKAAQDMLNKEIDDLRKVDREIEAINCLTPESRRKIKALQAEIQARVEYYIETIRFLEIGEKWTRQDEAAHNQMWEKVKEARAVIVDAFKKKPQKPD
jgi:membrane associated rhomboid family serine protease